MRKRDRTSAPAPSLRWPLVPWLLVAFVGVAIVAAGLVEEPIGLSRRDLLGYVVFLVGVAGMVATSRFMGRRRP